MQSATSQLNTLTKLVGDLAYALTALIGLGYAILKLWRGVGDKRRVLRLALLIGPPVLMVVGIGLFAVIGEEFAGVVLIFIATSMASVDFMLGDGPPSRSGTFTLVIYWSGLIFVALAHVIDLILQENKRTLLLIQQIVGVIQHMVH